jgi:hypothetical protein
MVNDEAAYQNLNPTAQKIHREQVDHQSTQKCCPDTASLTATDRTQTS